MKIDAQLLVWLKGADLAADTAYLTLVGKMGYGDRLAAIRRFDYLRLGLDSGGADPETTVAALAAALDRQSTFYNRNKHAYALECAWDGGRHRVGASRDEVRNRWAGEISKLLRNQGLRDFDGKPAGGGVILNGFKGFLAEVLVEDEDPSARESVAARLRGGLGGARVSCRKRAVLWWLVVRVQTRSEAEALAREIVVTTRRDRGLLMNPNYQSAEFVSVKEV